MAKGGNVARVGLGCSVEHHCMDLEVQWRHSWWRACAGGSLEVLIVSRWRLHGVT